MVEDAKVLKRIREELAGFNRTMEELYLLKSVAEDLKSFRRMIKVKRYD